MLFQKDFCEPKWTMIRMLNPSNGFLRKQDNNIALRFRLVINKTSNIQRHADWAWFEGSTWGLHNEQDIKDMKLIRLSTIREAVISFLRQCNCYYLFLIYDISYDCDNVFVWFFCLMIDDDWYYSNSYRSQTALPIRSAGTRGMKRGFVCFRPRVDIQCLKS